MRMICKKYRWTNSIPPNDVNFFSSSNKTLVETIDLADAYIINTLSEFETEIESVNEVTNTIDKKMSNVTFKLKNDLIQTREYNNLQEFFEVYKENDHIKFEYDYYDEEDNHIFHGYIYKDGVSFENRINDIIDVIAVSEEKEFIDYYSQKKLIAPELIPPTYLLGLNLNGQKWMRLIHVLQTNFPMVNFGDFPANYYIADKPYTYAPIDKFEGMNNFIHIKTGYSCYVLDEANSYEYFSSLLNSKGWVWYFELGKLHIRQRANNVTNTLTVDYNINNILPNHSVKSEILDKQVDIVIIDNGSYFDNLGNEINTLNGLSFFNAANNLSYNLSGQSGMIFTNQTYSNKNIPFNNVTYSSSTDKYLLDFRYLDYTRFIPSGQGYENFYVYEKIRTNNVSPYTITAEYYNYPIKRTLEIRPIINSNNNSGGFDKNNPRANSGAYYGNGNFFNAANKPTQATFVLYNGNPASSMIKYNEDTGKYISYEIECRQADFGNNFRKFMRSANPIIFEIELKQRLDTIYQNVKIINYPYSNLIDDKYFSILKHSYNDTDKTTKLTLQMQ